MASLADCIKTALDAGRLSKEDADDLTMRVDQLRRHYREKQKGEAEATALADADALRARAQDIKDENYQKALQAIAIDRNVNRMLAHPKGPRVGLLSILARDITALARHGNVDFRAKAILGQAHSQFAKGLEKLRTTFLGFRQDRRQLERVVRELFGQETGNAEAKQIAKAWAETAETLRKRFNRAGGRIPKRADWGLPQGHDPRLVGKAGKDEWVQFISKRLNRSKMLDENGIPLADAELRELLDSTFDTISTNGVIDIVPGRIQGTKLANRRRDRRFLIFNDADAWLEYQQRFGPKEVFTVMTDHLERMSNEIALLETLGPNPNHAYNYLRDVAVKNGMGPLGRAFTDSMFRVVARQADATSVFWLADLGQAVRNWLTSAKLGGAALSALSDVGFLQRTAQWNDLSATKISQQFLRNLNPANAADRLAAVKMGLTAEAWTRTALGGQRFTEVTGSGFSARAADFTIRGSGLTAWTDAWKKGFGMEYMSRIADEVDKPFNGLSKLMRSNLEAYGFDARTWNQLRGTELMDFKGTKFFSIENLMGRQDLDLRAKQELATRFQEMILTETSFAVPEPDARVRVFTTGGLARGTIAGELLRTAAQFKSFPITIVTSHLWRGLFQAQGLDKASYLAQLMIATTVMGAIVIQAKDIARGRDPRPTKDPRFWGAAFVQGGGAGIIGDFLFSDINRFGRGPFETLTGPGFSLVADLARISLGNAYELSRGDDPNLTGELIRFARQYTPGGSLWYTRLALEREVFDQLQALADPKAAQKFRRLQRRRKKDFGQEFFWKPGRASPSRAPDLENLASER